MWFSVCCCSITWKGDEEIYLPSLARLVFQFPGSPSHPAASAPVINIPCLLKGTSQRQRERRRLLGLKSREGACRDWAGRSQVALAGSRSAVILFGTSAAGRWRKGKVVAKAAFNT